MLKRICDVCGKEIYKLTPSVKVFVIDGDGVDNVLDSHITCLSAGTLNEWLRLSKLGKVEILTVGEGMHL